MKTQIEIITKINELREEASYLRSRAIESAVAIGDCPESQAWAAEATAAEEACAAQ